MLVNKVWRKWGVSLQDRYIGLLLIHMMCVVIRPDVVDWSHELGIIFTVPPIVEVLYVSSVNSHRVENSYQPSLLYRMTCSRLKPVMAKDMSSCLHCVPAIHNNIAIRCNSEFLDTIFLQ